MPIDRQSISQAHPQTTPPFRIAQVVRPATGGMRRHLATLLCGLDPAEFVCSVYAPAKFDLDWQNFHQNHLPVEIGAKTRPLADLRTISKLAGLLRGQTDLIHAHGLRGALIGVMAARGVGAPAVFTAHNLVPSLPGPSRWILRSVALYAIRIIAVSRAVADSLAAAGIDPAKITVIPNGIDPTPFEVVYDTASVRRELGIGMDSPIIMGIGRLSPEKGFDILIEAFRLIRQQATDATLVLVGDGPAEAELKRQAARLEQESKAAERAGCICFTGAVANAAPLLAAADLVAIPSRQEGQGIVALEAMTAGRAIVASRVGGLTETVRDGECGLLVSPEDPAALASALLKLLSDQALRKALAGAGRERVKREYTASLMLQRTSEIYREAIYTSRRRGL